MLNGVILHDDSEENQLGYVKYPPQADVDPERSGLMYFTSLR